MTVAPLVALLFAAPLAAAQYASDAVLLEQTLRALHPGLHRHQTPAQVDAHFAALHRDLGREGTTRAEAFLAISRLTAALRCGHTYPNPSNQSKTVREELFGRAVPPVRLEGRRMFLESGEEVLAIDSMKPAKVIDTLLPLVRGDGSNDGKRLDDLATSAFDLYYPLVFPGDANTITTRKGTQTIARIKREKTSPNADDSWQFTRDGDTATLKLGTFSTWSMKRDWRAFLRESFAAARDAKKLVIDIRGNEGGDEAVIDELLRHMTVKPIQVMSHRQLVRYRKLPAEFGQYVSSWDDSFRDFGELPPYGDGFFLRKEAATRTIEPAADAFKGNIELLIDEANSSATFELARIAKENRLATLIGRETGGNRRGTNGGRIAFLKLPASGIEVDVPLVGYYPATPQPDRGIVPDRRAD